MVIMPAPERGSRAAASLLRPATRPATTGARRPGAGVGRSGPPPPLDSPVGSRPQLRGLLLEGPACPRPRCPRRDAPVHGGTATRWVGGRGVGHARLVAAAAGWDARGRTGLEDWQLQAVTALVGATRRAIAEAGEPDISSTAYLVTQLSARPPALNEQDGAACFAAQARPGTAPLRSAADRRRLVWPLIPPALRTGAAPPSPQHLAADPVPADLADGAIAVRHEEALDRGAAGAIGELREGRDVAAGEGLARGRVAADVVAAVHASHRVMLTVLDQPGDGADRLLFLEDRVNRPGFVRQSVLPGAVARRRWCDGSTPPQSVPGCGNPMRSGSWCG